MSIFFFFNDTATTEIYTLSLHDALPILPDRVVLADNAFAEIRIELLGFSAGLRRIKLLFYRRSEEHTSELQSPCNLVCRLLLEKKKDNQQTTMNLVVHRLPRHTLRPRDW